MFRLIYLQTVHCAIVFCFLLKIGFYHYLTATSVEAARRQADYFISVISGKQYDCKLAMDYEEFFGEGKT
ncbi:MAG: hypothetical protein II399_03580, partial [Lachnospiraceae bacterium]|nr:hypothetical protein [Lachnospiraceae bacterium]